MERWSFRFIAGFAETLLAGAFLALAIVWAFNPSLTLEPSIVVVGALAGALDLVRRRFSPEAPAGPTEALEPFPLRGIGLKDWRTDPVIGQAIQSAEAEGASFEIPLINQVPRKQAEGFTYFLTEDGRPCHYFGTHSSGEEFVLMVRRTAV
jgi:hypothetical protein